jgi:tripeptide aminopeptidase
MNTHSVLATAVLALSLNASAADDKLAPYVQQATTVLATPAYQQAAAHIDANKDSILKEWIALTEINAPSGHEQERAKYVAELLRGYQLDDVRIDEKGSVIALRKGTEPGPAVVFDAHLDTVFQPGMKIKVEMRDGWLHAPGIGDDTRNLEAMLAIIRALNHAQVRTKRDVLFTFTVSEETDFSGANHFIKQNKDRISQFVALDGGFDGFAIGGTSFKSSRFHFIGPGGHTKSKNPPYSATLPLARAIARVYKLKVPKSPATYVNIGMLGGSAVPNAKAADAWFSMDLRSASDKITRDLDRKIVAICEAEARKAGMKLRVDADPYEPAAQLPNHRESHIVRSLEAIHQLQGFKGEIHDTASNHANVALLNGIPALSTGAAPCEDSHAITERCAIEPFYRGTKKILALLLMLTGSQPRLSAQ